MKFITLFITLFLIQETYSQCVGSSYCTVCKNCSRCRYCKAGGTCGVCGGGRNYKRARTRSKPSSSSTYTPSNYNSLSENSYPSPLVTPVKSERKQKKQNKLNSVNAPLYTDTTNTEPDYDNSSYPTSYFPSSSYNESNGSGYIYFVIGIVVLLLLGKSAKNK